MPAWSSLTPIGSALDDLAQRFGLSGKLLEHRLQRQWTATVGQHVAAHTRPESIRFKKLYVIADSSVWMQQLAFLKPSLIESINASAGSPIVTDIVLRVGEVAHESPQGTDPSHVLMKTCVTHTLTEESLAEVSRHAEAVEDLAIRTHLVNVMARALAKRPDPRKSP